jgi:hypothetical protein
MAGVSACKKSKDASVSPTDWTNKIKSLYTYNHSKVTITEGISGTVTKRTGNCMPVVDSNNTTCKEVPVHRNVYIYEYTTLNNIKGDIKDFQPPATQLKALIKTDAEGFYQYNIGPGIYSIFVEENGAFYANSIDAQGGINPVEVIAGKVSTSNPVIDYATY